MTAYCADCGELTAHPLIAVPAHDCARAQAVNAGSVSRYEVRRSEYDTDLPWAVVDTVNGTLVQADDDDNPGPCWATEGEARVALAWIEEEPS